MTKPKFNRTPTKAPAWAQTTSAIAAACALALGAASVQAQSATKRAGPPDFVAFGVATVPEFAGSSESMVLPAVLGRFTLGPTTLRLQGIGAQLNVLPANSPWAAGPVIGFRGARDADVKDDVVKRLRPIDSGATAGAFVEYSWRDLAGPGDGLTAGVELIGGNTGGLSRLNLGYQLAPMGDLRLNFGLRLTQADSKYQETYFSIDADNARRSGLPRFEAGSGVQEASVSIGANYALSRQWMLIGFVQTGRLMGDAADSPIVKLRGNTNQSSVSLAVGYLF